MAVEASIRKLGRFQYLAVAVGCMLGVGWITVLGEWLARAGPLGAIAGFALGAIVMTGVAACYAELTGMMPVSGGDVVFAQRVLGRPAAFLVGWFLLLAVVSIISFEMLSFAWVVETLWPASKAPPIYTLLGNGVSGSELLTGLGSLAAIYGVNRMGMNASAGVQDGLFALKICIVVLLVGLGLLLGHPQGVTQLSPPFDAGSQVRKILWVAATSAYWLGGFQVIGQLVEDRTERTSLRSVGLTMVGSILVGLAVYVGLIAAAGAAAPVDRIVEAPLPAAYVAEAIFRSPWGARVVLCAGLAGILATMNAMFLSGSRILTALVKMDLLPPRLGSTDQGGVPARALTLIAAVAATGSLAGRGLLIPIVNTSAISLIFCYALACSMTLYLRHAQPLAIRPFRIRGGSPVVLAITVAICAMALFLLVEPAIGGVSLPPVEWVLLGGWGAAGWLLRSLPSRQPARAENVGLGN